MRLCVNSWWFWLGWSCSSCSCCEKSKTYRTWTTTFEKVTLTSENSLPIQVIANWNGGMLELRRLNIHSYQQIQTNWWKFIRSMSVRNHCQGHVPFNKEWLTWTVPVNKVLLTGAVPVNNSIQLIKSNFWGKKIGRPGHGVRVHIEEWTYKKYL